LELPDALNGVWVAMGKPQHKFDTSALTAGALISAAVFSVWGTSKDTPSATVEHPSGNNRTDHLDINIVNATSAGDAGLAVADYDAANWSHTRLATEMTNANFTTGAYNDFTLNVAGIAAINKTGNTSLGAMTKIDFETWGPFDHSAGDTIIKYNIYYADQAGTANDPKLVITYTNVGTNVDTANYTSIRKITIDNTKVGGAANLTDYPMKFTGTYDGTGGEIDLRTVANGGVVTSATGKDIEFCDDVNGTTKYPHEVVDYNATTGYVEIDVKIPIVDHDDDTDLHICAGNSGVTTARNLDSDVWSNGYEAVWHLQDSLVDSRSGITMTNSGADQADAKLTRGLDFVRANSDFVQSNFFGGYINGDYTSSCWVNFDNLTTNFRVLDSGDISAGQMLDIWGTFSSANALRARIRGGATTIIAGWADSNLSAETWYHVAGVYDKGTDINLLVNGDSKDTTADTISDDVYGSYFRFGVKANDETTDLLDGFLDEVRFSSVARTDGWLLTEYNNQNSPSTFYSMGAELQTSGGGGKLLLLGVG
jgi:hypothetical protein